MTAQRMYGYLQLPLLRCTRQEVEKRIEHAAADLGGRIRQVFTEPAPATDVLWSLLIGVDRSWGGQLMPAFTDMAERRGEDVPRLLDRGRRGTRAVAWQTLLSELRRSDGGSVIVPGPEHLDGLGKSRSALLHQLSRMRPVVHVLYLPNLVPIVPRPPRAPETEVICQLVGEFRVKAFASALEVTLLKASWHLSQAGLSYLVADAEAVLHELVRTRISTEPMEEPDEIRVRLLRTAHTLVIDLHESQNHVDEPVPAIARQRCTRVARHGSVASGTITWCELPLADPGTAGVANAVHRYHQFAAPAAGGELR